MKPICLIFIQFGLFATLHAGSILSSNGIGQPLNLSDASALGKGGISLGIRDPHYINRENPAAMEAINLTRFSIHFLYEQNRFKTDAGEARSPYANFNGFYFAVPIASRAAVSLGLAPKTRLDYDIALTDSLQGQPYKKSVSGQGGVNALDLSIAYAVSRHASFGITWQFNFGKVEENWLVEYNSSAFQTSHTVYEDNFRGSLLSYGIQIHPFETLHLGAVYSPGMTMNTESTQTYAINSDTVNSKLTLPGASSFGFSWQASPKFMVGADYKHQDWRDYKRNNQPLGSGVSQHRFSMGCEYRPSRDPYAKLADRTIYRLGFGVSPYYVQDIEGNEIREMWFTAGLGLPFNENSTRINLALAYGKRGDLKKNGITENLFRLILSLDSGEKWFTRRQQ